ncbi:MAG: TPMT family class I SAM-dependent methyltransferase [Cyclobacteriaceae bacterium]|nr:TPMT family class I SAM-dependent methyltransferase [Cyclobacteriaceae bacterium]
MGVELNECFWAGKYETNNTGWDIGEISRPIKEYIDQINDKEIKILIPGGGNSYEAGYLYENGFVNVFVVDISRLPLENFSKRCVNFPKDHLIHANFFDIDLRFDLIIEQTFFCAINPQLRNKYAHKMHQLLEPNGKLIGVLFDDELNKDHPPFGGNKLEYKNHFKQYFNFNVFESCYNSIEPRKEKELFINLIKKKS